MKVIIAGAGDVGFHLAKLLAQESHDIVLIDKNTKRLDYADNHLDIMAVRGDATSYKTLKEANISKADLLIAVTSMQETNLATAIIGKSLGAKKTIARISNMEYLIDKKTLNLEDLGIDELISPESLAAREIKRLLKDSAVSDSFEFENGKLSLIGIQINENSPLLAKTLAQFGFNNENRKFVAVAIHRGDETIIPKGETEFYVNDHIYFIAEAEGTDDILHITGKENVEIKNIMILGGSRTGKHLCRRLSQTYHTKIVENIRDKCEDIADEFDNVLVINGDGTDVELLEEEGIWNMDAFIAVTGNSETNIISCIVAKNRGVKKTIAMVENIEYLNLTQNIGIDSLINKKLLAANFIFRYIRKGEIVSFTSIHGIDAEILEFNVTEKSKIIKKAIKDHSFPKTAIIGGVIRNNKGFIPNGDFKIEPNDRVVVFTQSDYINKVEKYFF
jgi:trk/ktr system potassium uptake protein